MQSLYVTYRHTNFWIDSNNDCYGALLLGKRDNSATYRCKENNSADNFTTFQ